MKMQRLIEHPSDLKLFKSVQNICSEFSGSCKCLNRAAYYIKNSAIKLTRLCLILDPVVP